MSDIRADDRQDVEFRRRYAASHVAAQVGAAWASDDEANRASELAASLREQDQNFDEALGEMQRIRDFVGSPETIIGSEKTKHGEIAEQVHVGVTRAVDALYGREPTATFENVSRTAATDYRISDGTDFVNIQSKYYNGIRRTLGGALEHARQHPEWEGRYHIPKDQFAQLEELRANGLIDGMEKQSPKIQHLVDDLDRTSDRSMDDLIQPGESHYDEVQQGHVHETIDNREGLLARQNEHLKQASHAEHGPTLEGLGTGATIAAAAGGGVRLAQIIWNKHLEGKNLFRGDYTAEDWQDVGLTTAKGAGIGSISGSALYLVTNTTEIVAPFAGALVSAIMGIGTLLSKYHAGTMDGDQFVEMSHIVGLDVAVVGLASLAGQTLIPIPALGALVGSLGGKFITAAIQRGLGKSESALIDKLAKYEKRTIERLDAQYRSFIQRLDAYFGNLERLVTIAFDNDVNTEIRLQASVHFAQAVGVPDQLILRTTTDLDNFMNE